MNGNPASLLKVTGEITKMLTTIPEDVMTEAHNMFDGLMLRISRLLPQPLVSPALGILNALNLKELLGEDAEVIIIFFCLFWFPIAH
jgi:hypothetical protein